MFLTLVCLAVMSPVLFFHHSTIFVNLDNVDQFYTWYQKLAMSWHHGYLPIWNANVYGGSSFAGELQQGVLYPVNWLWIALFGSVRGISELALNYLVTLHFVIASFGAYLLLKVMGAKKWSAFAAGLVFAFSGALAMRAASQTVIFFALAVVPYPLYFYQKYQISKEKKYRDLVFAGLSLGLILLVGHIQPFFHALLALAVIELVFLKRHIAARSQAWPRIRESVKKVAIVGAAAIAIALPQLWISASYLPNAYRVQSTGYVAPGNKISYEDFARSFNLNPHEFTNLIDPVSYPVRDGNDPFIGLAPLAIIVLALVMVRTKFKKVKLWQEQGDVISALLILSVVAMLGYATWFAVVLYKLPLVYQIRQLGRYVVLLDLALAAIVAVSLEAISEEKINTRQRINLAIIGGFLALQFAYLFLLRHYIFGTHLALQYGVIAALILGSVTFARFKRTLLIGSVIATVIVSGFWFLPKLKSDTETVAAYTQSPALISTLEQTNGKYRVGFEENALPINSGDVFNFQTTAGYSATISAPFYEFAHKSNLDPNFINDILGVQMIAKKTVTNKDMVVFKDPAKNVSVVTRPTALPKFFTTTNKGSTARADYQGLVVTTEDYKDQYQKYVVDVPKAGDVIASELYFPGWQAVVDGKPAQIAEYTVGSYPLLKQLNLPAGKHTVEFRYKAFKLF